MRTLSVIEFLTLDGVMQSLGSPDEDTDGGFQRGGWAAPYGDDVLAGEATRGLAATTAYLFGRRTYEKMATYWPQVGDGNPMAAHLNRTPKYVATNSLTELAWAGSQRLSGEVTEQVEALKAQPGAQGRIAVLGSGVLVQTLIAADLVDEYVLFLHPLLLGQGKRLFQAAPRPVPLQLVAHNATTTGVLMLTYAVLADGTRRR